MVGHGGSSASSYLADPTSPIPSHCASTVATSTVRVKSDQYAETIDFLPDESSMSVIGIFPVLRRELLNGQVMKLQSSIV